MTSPEQMLREASMRAYYVQNINHTEDPVWEFDSKYRELINTVFYWMALFISLWGAIYVLVFLMSAVFDAENKSSNLSLELLLHAAYQRAAMINGSYHMNGNGVMQNHSRIIFFN